MLEEVAAGVNDLPVSLSHLFSWKRLEILDSTSGNWEKLFGKVNEM